MSVWVRVSVRVWVRVSVRECVQSMILPPTLPLPSPSKRYVSVAAEQFFKTQNVYLRALSIECVCVCV